MRLQRFAIKKVYTPIQNLIMNKYNIPTNHCKYDFKSEATKRCYHCDVGLCNFCGYLYKEKYRLCNECYRALEEKYDTHDCKGEKCTACAIVVGTAD